MSLRRPDGHPSGGSSAGTPGSTSVDRDTGPVPERILFVQLKSGHDIDMGPCWISRVRFSTTWQTAYWHGRALRRWPGMPDANFVDVESGETFWLSGPHRDRRDTRYSNVVPHVDPDAREAYERFLLGEPLPGRDRV